MFHKTTAALVFVIVVFFSFGSLKADAANEGTLEVWKSPSCGCCSKWVSHMASNGYKVKVNDVTYDVLTQVKKTVGLVPELASCHTAKISGYVIEGHVPVEDVIHLLRERPDAIGLAVPGMPTGSPGMEYSNEQEPYEVLLVKKSGAVEVFSRHAQ